MFLHFAAVDTSIAGKIQKNGLVDFLGICYALFQILEAVEVIWAIVGVEKLYPTGGAKPLSSVSGVNVFVDSLTLKPDAKYTTNAKTNTPELNLKRYFLQWAIVWEFYFSNNIKS